MIERSLVLLADKSLYDTWIRLNIDVSCLEKVGEELGRILAPNRIESKVLESIRRMRISSQQSIVWKTRVKEDNKNYLNLLGQFTHDIPMTLFMIENETKTLLKLLNKLDEGASEDDVDLMSNAKWIRLNTTFEPMIITDDRDLLTCGHIISSFFGLTIGFLSGFEVFRLLNLDNAFIEYCKYYRLGEDLDNASNSWSKEELELKISNVLKKARIACHPSLSGPGSLLRKIRR